MLENLSKILIVDNEQREIEKISKAFKELNIPIYTLHYSQARPPEKPFTGIRLAFFDIKLQDGNDVDIPTITSFVNALKKCIASDNGPFILIFWSSHVDKIEAIKEFINTRFKDKIPTPTLIDSIDKITTSTPAALHEEIRRVISKDVVKILYDFENKIALAAGKTLKTLFDVISNGKDSWGNSSHFEENIDLVFSNIACETLGYVNAKQNPLLAIQHGLNPILANELSGISLSDDWKKKMKILLESKDKTEFKKVDQDHISKLNAIYHLNFDIKPLTKKTRGVVIEAELQDDQMNLYFGMSAKQVRHTMLPFDSNKISKKERQKIYDATKFVILEISASCDYAQNNPRTYTYILGLLTPKIDNDVLKNRSESVIALPEFYFRQQDYQMFLNSRYTITASSAEPPFFGDILFQVKIELMNKISILHSNYISRVGIVQF